MLQCKLLYILYTVTSNGDLCILDVLCIFNFRLFTARSPSKDALESAISDIYFNFALPSLWNLLFNFLIWCRLS